MIIKPLVIDISHHNTIDDFVAVRKAGVVGVIHKATEGTGMVDKTYALRRKQAVAARLMWGAYHFNSGQDVEAQVEHFFDVTEPDEHTLMALDFEDNKKSQMSIAQAKKFLQLGDAKLGRQLMIYSGNRIKELLPKPDKFFGSHRLWLCQYGQRPKLPAAWSSYWIWQYAADGVGPQPHKVRGVQGKPDVNTSELTPDQLAAEWAGEPVAVA